MAVSLAAFEGILLCPATTGEQVLAHELDPIAACTAQHGDRTKPHTAERRCCKCPNV